VGRVPDRIFLDANVIFSAAYRPATDLRQLWALPDIRLLTSPYAISEVERNLHRTRHSDLQFLLQAITFVPTPPPEDHRCRRRSSYLPRMFRSSSPRRSRERRTC
jgi:hypothetical protein